MESDYSSQVRAEAAAWLARLHADNRDAADEAAFRTWLAAGPDHAAAFEAVDRMWSAVGGVPREEEGKSRTHRHFARRAALAGLGLFAAAGSGFALLRPAAAQIYETGIGEQKHVSLKDGSNVLLDAQTRLSAQFTDETRRIHMDYGRANFLTAGDEQRPFIVETALRAIVSNHCNFDVNCDENELQVVVTQGQAIVEPKAGTDFVPAVSVRGGERLAARGLFQQSDRPDLAAILSWHTGLATFDDTSLKQAAQEMNRYSVVRLQVSPDIANFKVSGVYRVGENAAFARSIAKLLPITIQEKNGAIVLARKSDG